MAFAEPEMRYASPSVHGSLAYDISRTAAAPEFWPETEPEYTPETTPDVGINDLPDVGEEQRARAHVRSKARTAPRVSLLAISGFALAGVLLVLVLLSYVSLTKLSDSSVALKKEISALEQEETKLRVKYESVFDLNAIEEYAVGTLGMVKADSSQISYLDAGAEDKAVILGEESGGVSGALRDIKSFFGSIKESLS